MVRITGSYSVICNALKFLNVIIHSCSFFKRTSLSLKAQQGQFSGVALRQVSGNTFLCTFSSFLLAVSS